jgi:hypothetical protein
MGSGTTQQLAAFFFCALSPAPQRKCASCPAFEPFARGTFLWAPRSRARLVSPLRPTLLILLTPGYIAHGIIPEMSSGEQALMKKPSRQADLSIAIRKIMQSFPLHEP